MGKTLADKILLAVFVSAIAMAFVKANASPAFDIDSFVDGRDGTALLNILCSNGKRIAITMKREKLDTIKIDRLYDLIEGECSRAKSSNNGSFGSRVNDNGAHYLGDIR